MFLLPDTRLLIPFQYKKYIDMIKIGSADSPNVTFFNVCKHIDFWGNGDPVMSGYKTLQSTERVFVRICCRKITHKNVNIQFTNIKWDVKFRLICLFILLVFDSYLSEHCLVTERILTAKCVMYM